MKILVMPKPIEGVSREEMLRHAPAEIQAVCRAVGFAGRHRAFWLTTRFVCSFGAGTFSMPAKAAQRLDALVLRSFPFVSRFASRLVWEARKES